jgi:hypothetical protein
VAISTWALVREEQDKDQRWCRDFILEWAQTFSASGSRVGKPANLPTETQVPLRGGGQRSDQAVEERT